MVKFKLIFLILLFPSVLWATDYYVDNTCGTNGNGTTQTCGATGPFNSLANAQSGLTGDQSDNRLLLKKGQTFSGQFTVGAYGTSGHPFTIGAYGTGANPIISGGGAMTVVVLATSKNYITIDGLTITGAASASSWTGSLHILTSEGWIIQNSTFTGNTGVVSGGWIENSKNFVIDNCIFSNNGAMGLEIQQSVIGTDIVTNFEIKNCLFSGNGIAGLGTGSGNGLTQRLTHFSIHDNEATDNSTGIYLHFTDDSSIYRNKCHHNTRAGEPYGFGIASCYNSDFYENEVYDNLDYGWCIFSDDGATFPSEETPDHYGPNTYCRFYRNLTYNHTTGVGWGINAGHPATATYPGCADTMNYNSFYDNIFWNNNIAFQIDDNIGNVLYNNTFYGNGISVKLGPDDIGLAVKNNIFSESTTYDISASPVSTGLTVGNNLYYRATAGNQILFNGGNHTTSAWKTDHEATAVITNPLFVGVSTWSDFRLQSSSSAINAGANLGTTYQNALNPDDLTWPPSTLSQDSYDNWEIGAFLYKTIGGPPYKGIKNRGGAFR